MAGMPSCHGSCPLRQEGMAGIPAVYPLSKKLLVETEEKLSKGEEENNMHPLVSGEASVGREHMALVVLQQLSAMTQHEAIYAHL